MKLNEFWWFFFLFDPDLKRIMAESRDVDELAWAWVGWRNVTGVPCREDFELYVNLSNLVAQENGIRTDDNSLYYTRIFKQFVLWTE